DGYTAFYQAARYGEAVIVQELLENNIGDMTIKANNGSTPLHAAAANGHTNVVKILLKIDNLDLGRLKTNPSLWSRISGLNSGETALELAAANGHFDALKLMLGHKSIDHQFLMEHTGIMLYRASDNGHLEIVQMLLTDYKLYIQPSMVQSAFDRALSRGHIEIVQRLLQHGEVDMDLKNRCGDTPLQSAVAFGHLDVVRVILAKLALHSASGRGYIEIVRLLLAKKDINVNIIPKQAGHKALDIALAVKCDKVARMLLECPGTGFTVKVDFLPFHKDFKSLIEAPDYIKWKIDGKSATTKRDDDEYAHRRDEFYYSPLSPTAGRLATSINETFQAPCTNNANETEDSVHFLAYAPPVVPINTTFVFAIWAYLANQRHDMHDAATADDSQARQLSREMVLPARRGAIVHVHLEVPDGFVVLGDGPPQGLNWNGKMTSVKYNISMYLIIVGAKVMMLKSFLFVSQELQKVESSMNELQSTLELIPQQYEEIRYQDLNLKELVRQGHFGDAFRAEYKGKDVVAKTLRAQTFGESSDDIVQEFRHEATALSMFGHHPNIVPFVGASTDLSQPLALVTAYLPYGSLSQYLSKNEMTIEQKQTVLKDAAAGLLNIHEGRFIHRDMATRNLLIDDHVHAKICDFGLCRRMDSYGGSHFESGVGPLKYMAPESMSPPHSFSYRSYAYSFGVLMWETFTEATPYNGLRGDEAAALVLEGKCLNACAEGIPAKYIKLMARCFSEDPSKRPSMTDIFNSLNA
ncbi:unnamed protein product, partial [Aphanomyces euteiches]